MKPVNMFYKEAGEYKNKLDPLRDCYEQYREYIKNLMGISLEDAGRLTMMIMKKSFKDRQIRFFEKLPNGDRRISTTSVYAYIKANVKEGNIIVPTFTTYVPSNKQPSVIGGYIDGNVKARSISKKEARAAEVARDIPLFEFKNGEQNNKKIQNNEISGLFAVASSVIANPTGHNTLTSTVRTNTAMTNTSNERLIGGNRIFYKAEDVLRSIVNESTYARQDMVTEAVREFNIHIPTVDEVVDTLKYSSDLYFKDENYYQTYIIPYLNTLTPEQRATIVYTTDLHHFKKYNDALFRTMMGEMIKKVSHHTENIDDVGKLYKIPDAIRFFVHNIFENELRGLGADYSKIPDNGLFMNLYETALNIVSVLDKYSKIFIAFFQNDIAPINSHKLRNAVRRAVVLSDTDSSAFSVDEYVKWFFGRFVINEKATALAGALTYIASENVVHQLAKISSVMNIEIQNLFLLAMKNEWLWYVHIPTVLSKHYMADAAIQEGVVHMNTKLETKGVHLKSSNVPKEIILKGDNLIKDLFAKLREGRDVKLSDILKQAISIEDEVIASIESSETRFFKSGAINEASAYSQDEDRSNFRFHKLWVEVFEPKYGTYGEPPYSSIILPLDLKNKTALKDWLAKIEDRAFADRMSVWLERNNRKDFKRLRINSEFVTAHGIPEELINVIDHEEVIKSMTTQIRTILGALGVLLVDEVPIREQYSLEQIEAMQWD